MTRSGWTCEENCGYECMHSVTEMHVKAGIPVRQFYGKVGVVWLRPTINYRLVYVMWSVTLALKSTTRGQNKSCSDNRVTTFWCITAIKSIIRCMLLVLNRFIQRMCEQIVE